MAIAQPQSIYRQRKLDLSQEAPWHGAAALRLARRYRVQSPTPAGVLRANLFLQSPCLPFLGDSLFHTVPIGVTVNITNSVNIFLKILQELIINQLKTKVNFAFWML